MYEIGTFESSVQHWSPRCVWTPLVDGNYLVPRNQHHASEYDVSPDGRGGVRFLMVRREPSSVPTHINVVFNWLAELERLVPTERSPCHYHSACRVAKFPEVSMPLSARSFVVAVGALIS